MKREKKKPRARTLSRTLQRKHEKLIEDRERLSALQPGGSAQRPERLDAASQLLLRAESYSCLACDGPLRYLEDRAEAVAGELRRVATAQCRHCGKRREIWFHIERRLLN